MAKKYLTIEEAAELLGVETSVLSRLREKGEIRAFADRGNWKFREDDVEELARKRQADSDPDVPIYKESTSKPPKDDIAGTVMLDQPTSGSDSDSSISLGTEADETLGNQPTIVRKGGLDDLMGSSDSDVRLVFDDNLMPDASDDDVPMSMNHSDSDVRLINKSNPGSDSDVKLVTDKAAVKTPASKPNKPGKPSQPTDCDVTLVGKNDSFSLDLEESDGSFVFGGEASGIALGGMSEDDADPDSGITLDLPNDSGIALDTGDSGISLDPGGSGISLEADDSSLVLAGDSGISLGGPSDSGIALDSSAKKKGKTRQQAHDDLGNTMPEIPMMHAAEDDLGSTQMEVPMLGGETEFEFAASPLDDDSSASVPMLGDADEPASKSKKKGKKQEQDSFDSAATSEFGADEDAFDSNADVFAADDDSDDMEVADDVIGEDDEIAEDVFGAGDEDFDDEMQSGQSSADFAVPSMGGGRVSAPVQAEWGGATFGMLLVSSVVMLLTSFVMYDVVRTMWGNNEPNAGTEMILSSFRGMFS